MGNPPVVKSFMRVSGIDAGPRTDAPPAYLHWIRLLRYVLAQNQRPRSAVEVKKKHDDTSSRLFLLCCSATRAEQVQIETLRFERGAFRPVSRWTLSDVLVESYDVGSDGETETIVLDPGRISMQSLP